MAVAMELRSAAQGLPNDGKSEFKDNAPEEDNADMRSTFCSTTMPTLSSFPTLSELPDMLEDDLMTPLITNETPVLWSNEQASLRLSSEESHAGSKYTGYRTKMSFKSLDAVKKNVAKIQQYSLPKSSSNTEFGSDGGTNCCSSYFMAPFDDDSDIESFKQLEGQRAASLATTGMETMDAEGLPEATVCGNVYCHSLKVETDDDDPPRLCYNNYDTNYGDWMENCEPLSWRDDPMLSELPREESPTKSKCVWHKNEKGFNGFDAVKKEDVQVSRRLKYVLKPSDAKIFPDNLSDGLVKPLVMNNSDSVDATICDEEFKRQIMLDPYSKEADKMCERLYAQASWQTVNTLNDIPSADPFGNELAEMKAMAGAPGRALRKRRPSARKC